MSYKYKEGMKWILTLLLVFLCIKYSPFAWFQLTPEGSFRDSEKGRLYGPSEIIEVIDYGDIKIFFAKYKKWVSADAIRRKLFFWSPRGGGIAHLTDEKEMVSFSYFYSYNTKATKEIICVYGVLHDNEIDNLYLEVSNEKDELIEVILPRDENNMFIYHYDFKKQGYIIEFLKGYDEGGNLIFEEKLYH